MKLALATALVLLVAAPAAQGATRYASTGGFEGGPCTNEFPCTFKTAIEGAGTGDEVIVKAGSYVLSNGATNGAANLTVRGEAPGVVSVTAPGTVVHLFGGGSVVRDLKAEVTAGIAVYA